MKRPCLLAAGPAAGSSRSVGVIGKCAEVCDPLEESGRIHGGFHFFEMTFRAGLAAGIITFQDRTIEGVSAVLAFVFDSRHEPIILVLPQKCNEKPFDQFGEHDEQEIRFNPNVAKTGGKP